LQESEARYRHLFRESPVSLLEQDFAAVRVFLETVTTGSERELRAALRVRPELVSEAVSRVKILDVNDATLTIFGAGTRNELQHKLEHLFVPETYEIFVEALCFLWRGHGGTFAAETGTLSLNGERRDIDLRMTVVPGSEQNWSHVVFSLFDTTAFKAAERELRGSLREKDVLIKEVHHRVKNNLQVITSLLNLQAMQMLDPNVRQQLMESQNRVQAIALVHEQLYRSKELSHVAFNDYTQALVEDLRLAQNADERGLRIAIDMNDVRLGVDAAIPCGLMLNELVTNAMKHAFPAARAGSIEIRMERKGARLTLSVSDDGIGLPPGLDPEQASTLGFDLVSTFAEQLEAEVAVDRSAGTRISISFVEK
jgi:two-component sensor histidine kinase